MAKVRFFKCPKCGTLLQLKIVLPENNNKWPYIFKHEHLSPDGKPCVIPISVDPNYNIREIGKC
ncbi:MAG: hypothetical protein ACTSX4_01625 [Candidatus Helarchaeota archaeon]